MAEKNLEKKIKELIFWTFVFFILYLIIGYLFQTGWLKDRLELKKIFDLIKDGLTITSAFLAPTAALVLFTDWRSEHHIKSIFQLLDDIKIQTNGIEDSLKVYIYKVFHPERDISDEFETCAENLKILSYLTNLKRFQQEISFNHPISNNYLILLKKLRIQLLELKVIWK
ncbi:hypothetical protein [Acinetobacter baumannii]|uniref:hypothetical protein n=1 Tax=Acinetobacter baumannii TaxID=470 RepID=UPI001AD82C91|nr:hypothetical protein [Acinetobacter baumannii]